jgi:hypothetical protein
MIVSTAPTTSNDGPSIVHFFVLVSHPTLARHVGQLLHLYLFKNRETSEDNFLNRTKRMEISVLASYAYSNTIEFLVNPTENIQPARRTIPLFSSYWTKGEQQGSQPWGGAVVSLIGIIIVFIIIVIPFIESIHKRL